MSKANVQDGGILSSVAFKMCGGAVSAALIIVPLSKWLTTQPTFVAADVGALVVAALLMMAGAASLLTTLDKRGLAKALDPEAGERAALSPRELGLMRLQAFVIFLAGMMLAAPPILADGAWPMDYAFAGLGVVFVIQVIANILVWRASDSFSRRLSMEAGALSFWCLQGALFLWAAAERMDLAPPLTAWSGIVILMAVYLLASFWTSMRRMGR